MILRDEQGAKGARAVEVWGQKKSRPSRGGSLEQRLAYLYSTSRISTARTPLGALIWHSSPTRRPMSALAMGLA